MENNKKSTQPQPDNLITRKEAIQKAGKYAAFTAATMMLLMSPIDSSAKKKSPNKPRPH